MDKIVSKRKTYSKNILWNLFCLTSVFGIWPRFIEPKLLFTTKKTLPISNLPKDLDGFKIVQFSDLHLSRNTTARQLERLASKINALNPDLIAYTGDFLCYGEVAEADRLIHFLNALKAPYGCYAVPGNHDYAEYICINANGDYDASPPPKSTVSRGFSRLIETITLSRVTTQRARECAVNIELIQLLKHTPFKLLTNASEKVKVGNTYINVCGFGEHMAGGVKPSEAYQGYDTKYPGILLLHNPDGIPSLSNHPGDVVLCGHTHGGQINIPGLLNKFCVMENIQYKAGAHLIGKKWAYINRGIGGTLSFRCFAPPELLELTLVRQ